MAECNDRLTPRDGLNNYHVVLARMELASQGGGVFTFAMTSSMLPIAEIQVNVVASGQSLDRMAVEAHDQLIDILRQLVFRADKARSNHERNIGRTVLPPLLANDDPDALSFMMEIGRSRVEHAAANEYLA